MQEFLVTARGQTRLVSSFEIVNHTLSMLLIGGTAGIAIWLWSHRQVGLGAVAAAIALALRLNGISHWIMWELATLFENIGTVQDGIRTLSHHTAVTDPENATPLRVARGEIRFENVRFHYGGEKRVIEDLSLVIKPGERIGLVGRSGAGKSTVVNLLLRFYDIEAGRILIDGQNIATATQESLRQQIGMVTQDTSLLHRSVRDNIMYGRPGASEEAMYAAARRAKADEFIGSLTDAHGRRGYDAHVGERGVKLSGGQRQRIALARVMLKDAPILLLDEATSALDSEVEAAIQETLTLLMRRKTVVAIAHRLSTIVMMDRLIVLDAFRLVNRQSNRPGSHIKSKLIGGAIALSALPVFFLVLWSVSVLNRNLESWFSRPARNMNMDLSQVADALDQEVRDKISPGRIISTSSPAPTGPAPSARAWPMPGARGDLRPSPEVPASDGRRRRASEHR